MNGVIMLLLIILEKFQQVFGQGFIADQIVVHKKRIVHIKVP